MSLCVMMLYNGVFMKKVALYCRTSTEMQEKGLDAQLRALQSYCEQKNITDYILFSDAGISGAKSSRPGLNKLLDAVRNGEIRSVICYSFSRFARSLKNLILALDEFNQLGVSFTSITESVDTGTPLGRTVFQIIGSIAELEKDLIRERVINGLKAATLRGKKLGRKKTYTNVDLFLQLRSSGLTIRQIASTVKCSNSTVIRMLNQCPPFIEQRDKFQRL